MSDPLPPHLAALVARARAEGTAPLGRLPEVELTGAGWPGLSYLGTDGAPAPATDPATAARTAAGGGLLGDHLTLVLRHHRLLGSWVQRPQQPNPHSALDVRRLTVLDVDPADVVLVERLAGPPAAPAVDLAVVRLPDLAAELAGLAFRPPASPAERAATGGTDSLFAGPDRRAVDVPSRLVHDWDAPTGVLTAWAYTLLGGRRDGDWVGRRPMTIGRARPALYEKHLRRRLGRRQPRAR
jgi:hypothetical protein